MSDATADLLSAAQSGDLASLRAALTAGADIHHLPPLTYETPGKGIVIPHGGKTALHVAVEHRHAEIAQELLAKGADPNAFSEGTVFITADAPLHIAARRGDRDMVTLLLAKGAKPDLRQLDRHDVPGRFPLQLAVEKGHADVVVLLLEPPGKASKDPASAALNEAAECGRESLARILVEHGADVTKPFRKIRSTPLTVACFCGYASIAKLFIDAGADVNEATRQGVTPLHAVVQGGWLSPDNNSGAEIPRDHAGVAALLLERGANVNAVDRKNKTPLQLAQAQVSLAPRLKSVIPLLESAINS